ncbi:MAG: ethanolamine ammonia-lyase subunit EutC [Planctomycetota bacterium]
MSIPESPDSSASDAIPLAGDLIRSTALEPFSPAWLEVVRQRTPARIFQGRSGVGYRSQTQLELRRDHAAALDAVHAEIDLERDFGQVFVSQWKLLEVQSQATSKAQYLMRPDLGRRLAPEASAPLLQHCVRGADLQIVIGDGLSAAAVIEQVPRLLPLVAAGAAERGLTLGQPFFVRYCRVGVLNDIGELLDPQVVVLLIGERPGLATAQSLSAYFAHRPRMGQTDAQRNLISNIHERGVPLLQAVDRILDFAQLIIGAGQSGVAVKENLNKLLG